MARTKPAQDPIHERLTSDLPINSVVSIAIVDDPYSSIGEKIKVIRSLREDPLAQMYHHQQIDDAHLAAGRMWQRYFEQSEIGSIRAIDPSKEAVDGGRMPEMITASQITAFQKLNECHGKLGESGTALVRDVLGERMSIRGAAAKRGIKSGYGSDQISRMFKVCLETMAVLWGFASTFDRTRTTP